MDLPNVRYDHGSRGDETVSEKLIASRGMREPEGENVVPAKCLEDDCLHIHKRGLVVEIRHTV